jgi:BirA family biotin operon repressor/biotin-[acetyl-CoA-carboxylase] ligase
VSHPGAPPPPPRVPVVRFERIDSTSRYARALLDAPTPPALPLLIVAAEQTGGVGRFARPWLSPRGGLWCTLAAPAPGPSTPPEFLAILGLRIGVACLDGVLAALGADATGLDVRLKWPNDVLVDDRKVLGVLTEIVTPGPGTQRPGAVLVGFGVNANFRAADLPPILHASATTLRDTAGRDFDLEELRADLARRLLEAVTPPPTPEACGEAVAGTIRAARARLARVGRPVLVTLPDRTTIDGTLAGLADDGRPLLHTRSGTITLPSGAELM